MDPIRWEAYIPDPTRRLPADDPDEDLPLRYEWNWEPFLPEAATEAEEAFQAFSGAKALCTPSIRFWG